MIIRNFQTNWIFSLDSVRIYDTWDYFQKTNEIPFKGWPIRFCVGIIGLFFCKYVIQKIFDIITWKDNWNRKNKIKCLQSCQRDVVTMIKNSNCNPIMLRLAWSDAGTYDKNISVWPLCGGCNGSIRLDNENQQTVNKGLEKALSLLFPIKMKYPSISWADLIQMAGANAVTLCGGPEILLKYGRIDIPKNYFPSEKSNLTFCISQSKKLPCNFFPYPDGSHTPEFHIRNVFFRLGFSSREIVALCGAHTIGRGFRDRTGVCPFSSGDRGATQYTRLTSLAKGGDEVGIGMAGGMSWTKNWLQFDNSYYKRPFSHTQQIRNESKTKSKHSNSHTSMGVGGQSSATNSRTGSFASTSTMHGGSENYHNENGRRGVQGEKDRRGSLSSVGSACSNTSIHPTSAVLSCFSNFDKNEKEKEEERRERRGSSFDKGEQKESNREKGKDRSGEKEKDRERGYTSLQGDWRVGTDKLSVGLGSFPNPIHIPGTFTNTPLLSPRELLEDQCSVDSTINSSYSYPDRRVGTDRENNRDREKEREREKYKKRENMKSTNTASTSSLCPMNNELLWLPTDDALFKSPEFKFYFEQYAVDQKLFFSDYSLVHKKMSELGSKFDPPCGIEI